MNQELKTISLRLRHLCCLIIYKLFFYLKVCKKMDRPILILGALREEINQIRRLMTIKEHFKAGRADAWAGNWEGTSIVLVRTGMGKDCALGALEAVLNIVNPALVLSTGYAGGLNLRLNVGDLVIADHILEIGPTATCNNNHPVDSQQLAILAGLDFPEKVVIHRGTLITVDQVVCDSSIKQELGLRHNALAVDMETSALIAHATGEKIPFISIRAISDTVEQSLVDISPFIGGEGEVSKLKAGWYVATHPHTIQNFISLRAQSQKATSNMTEILGIFLQAYTHLK